MRLAILTILLSAFVCSATPITITDGNGNTFTVYPIQELPFITSPTNPAAFVLEYPNEVKYAITLTNLEQLMGTNPITITSFINSPIYQNNLSTNQLFYTTFVYSPTLATTIITNTSLVQSITYYGSAGVPHLTITGNQTNYLLNDIGKVFTVSSSALVLSAGVDPSKPVPAWGYALQGGWTAYKMSNCTITWQNTNNITFVNPNGLRNVVTNGWVQVLGRGNSVDVCIKEQ